MTISTPLTPLSRLVVVGSANYDLMLNVPRLPRAGETISGDRFLVAAGGKGANQAVAAARLGAAVTFVACVGDDPYGKLTLDGLRDEGIDLSHVRVVPNCASGVAIVLTDASGENCIALSPGANAQLAPSDIDAAQTTIAQAGLLICQLESPKHTIRFAIEAARRASVPVLLNPAPAYAFDDDILRDVQFLVPNESEASALTGIEVVDADSAKRAAHALIEKGVQTVVITRGSAGVTWADRRAEREGFIELPAQPVAAIDTTGAGDTFIGAFAANWLRTKDVRAAITFAQLAAAYSVQRRGAQASMPKLAQLS
jgi:ribokinase